MIVKNDMKKVTLLIPVYNEEAMLPTLYQRLIELVNRNAVYEWEILFVNDGSSDTTLECLRRLRQQDKRVNYVNLSRNFAKGYGDISFSESAVSRRIIFPVGLALFLWPVGAPH